MKTVFKTAVVCLALIAATLTVFTATRALGAIELTAPEVVPAVSASKAQIMEIRLRFYTDGQNMMFKAVDGKTVGTAEGYVEWRTGNGDAPNFQTVTAGKYISLTAEDLAAILLAAQQVQPTEYLFGEQAKETPMDKLFPAIVAFLKSKGKM